LALVAVFLQIQQILPLEGRGLAAAAAGLVEMLRLLALGKLLGLQMLLSSILWRSMLMEALQEAQMQRLRLAAVAAVIRRMVAAAMAVMQATSQMEALALLGRDTGLGAAAVVEALLPAALVEQEPVDTLLLRSSCKHETLDFS
jgi:hypothetical protein